MREPNAGCRAFRSQARYGLTMGEKRRRFGGGQRGSLALVGLLLVLLAAASAQTGRTSPDSRSTTEVGVIIEAVSPGSAGDKAGLQVGDRIFSWSRETD